MNVRFGPFGMTACAYLALSLVAQAQFNYTTNSDNTLTITGYTGGIGSIDIPSSINGKTVTVIKDQAFMYNVILTRVTIPSTVTNIKYEAFRGCSSLTNITIGSGVSSMGSQVFWSCTNLNSVVISNGVTSIGASAFGYCTRLPSIVIPDSVTNIQGSAFQDCNKLTNAVIGNGVKSVGDWAFFRCTRLPNIEIGSGVNNIGDWVFDNCSSLTSITVNASNASYSSTNGVLFNKNKATLFRYPEGKGGSYAVPTGVTSIRYSSFFNCTNLTGVAVGGVTNIGAGAFSGCTSMATLAISNSIAPIGSNAFDGCRTLTDVMIGNGVTIVGPFAFRNCTRMGSVTIPGSVASLDDNAFQFCGGLANVLISNGVANIGLGAFSYCTNLSSVVIGNGATNIGQSVFYECTRLSNIVIPDSVISIGTYAFRYCTNLRSATIGSGVSSIGGWAFDGCTTMTGVYFRGNAPLTVGQDIFNDATLVIVYYILGTAGWPTVPDTWFGRPTALWNAATLSISPTNTNLSSAAASGKTIGVTASGAWMATSNVSWITITSGASGTGNGTVTFSVATNSASSRTGGIVVAGSGISRTSIVVQTGIAAPSAPTGVLATDGSYPTMVRVTWTNSSGATDYEVWRHTSNNSNSSSRIAQGIGGSPYDDATVAIGTSYYYWVKAANAGGTSIFSNVDSGYASNAIPFAPTGVSASDIYSDRIRITWTNSSGATGYEVWRNTNNALGSATKIGQNIVGSPFDDLTVAQGITNYYWLKATNSSGTSAFSSSDSGLRAFTSYGIAGAITYGGSQTGMVCIMALPYFAGQNSQALSLDGIDDGLVVEAPTITLQLSTQMTMSAWINVAGSLSGNYATMLAKYRTGTNQIAYIIGLRSSDGRPYANLGDANNFYAANGVWASNGWTHLAFTHDGTIGRWYINGQLNSATTNGPIHRFGDGSLYLGRYCDLQNYFNRFPGQLDDIGLWSRTLSQGEIQSVMTNGMIGTEPGLVSGWNFDDGTASDLTTNANHGQFMAGATTAGRTATGSLYSTVLAFPGAYTITNAPAGEYTIWAFQDSNGNGNMESWEANGIYPANLLSVTGNMANIDITLQDPISDSDDDGVTDYDEIYIYGSSWTNSDTDADGMPDGDEILAGSSPTNDASMFGFADSQPVPESGGVVVSWSSLSNRVYRLERSTNLLLGFEPYVNDIPADPPMNTYTDETPNVVGAYKVGVRME